MTVRTKGARTAFQSKTGLYQVCGAPVEIGGRWLETASAINFETRLRRRLQAASVAIHGKRLSSLSRFSWVLVVPARTAGLEVGVSDPVSESNVNPLDAAELRRAMQAFKRRMKLMRQEEESSLGKGPLSGGKRSTIVAIVPPNQFPKSVWDALVEHGKLRYSGHGLYELAHDPNVRR